MWRKGARPFGVRSNASSAGDPRSGGHQLLLDVLCVPRSWLAGEKVESASLAQQVQANIEHGNCAVVLLLGDVGTGHAPPVYHVGRPCAQHPKLPLLMHDDRGVLVQANAEESRILRNSTEKTTDAAALGEVLVDDHVLEVAQTGSHQEITAHPMAGFSVPRH